MVVPEKIATVAGAYDDLSRRSLSKIEGDLAKLIYLASTRDYNTGKYHHAGLATHFQEEIAGQALELAHREIFCQLAARSLEETVNQVEIYVRSSRQGCEEILHAWQQLEPYRVALPVDVNIAVAQLFVSNIKLALAILRRRYRRQEPET
jgi:hypothetical protein